MRIRTLMFSLLLITTLVVGGSVAAGARQGDPEDAKDDRKGTDLTLYATESAFAFVTATGVVNPEEEQAPSPGDRFLSVDTIYADEDRSDAVGRNDIECTFIEVTGTTETDLTVRVLCDGVLQLDGQGTLAWQGSTSFMAAAEPVTDESVITVAITGGTGAFAAAGGEVEVFDTTTDPEAPISRYEVTLLELERNGHDDD